MTYPGAAAMFLNCECPSNRGVARAGKAAAMNRQVRRHLLSVDTDPWCRFRHTGANTADGGVHQGLVRPGYQVRTHLGVRPDHAYLFVRQVFGLVQQFGQLFEACDSENS